VKKCPKCQTDNPDQAKFCLECGTFLVAVSSTGASTVNIGQGRYVESNIHTQGGDFVLRDKVLGDVLINSVKIIFDGADKQKQAKELLVRYLHWVIGECAPLRLAAIDQSAGQPGQRPLGLSLVYVDLNLEFRLPKKQNLAQFLATLPVGKEESEQREVQEDRLITALEALACHPALVLLGGPGSGKSTFSNYVALSLAEAGLGESSALERLGKDWAFGPLLPVRVVLRKFTEGLLEGRAADLWQFIDSELIKCGLPKEIVPVIHDIAEKGGALFLMDGLDEAGDARRREQVLDATAEFVRNTGPRCRFLLTARPYAWDDLQSPRAEMLVRYSLASFDERQMQTFIERWYRAVHTLGWVSASDMAEKIASLETAVQRPDLRPLAKNPLLLTLMATLHTNRGRLPDDRADLYDEVVKLLLQRWNAVSGAERSLLEALATPSLKLDDLRDVIEQIAYEAHARHVDKSGTADLSETDLLNAFRPLLGGSWDKAALVVAYIETRAGLLLGQGQRECVRQFTFPHRTFQEYLAGCYLARQVDFNTCAASLARSAPDHWREALVLAARRAGRERGVSVADELLHHQDVGTYQHKHGAVSKADWRAAVLAGQQLLELGLAMLGSYEAARVVRERVTGWLVALLENSALPVPERVQAGNLLAKLGDPRPEVTTINGMQFCLVPPGPFIMGSNENDDEKPLHTNDCLSYPYWIARYPVTVAQWRAFVESTNFKHEYWQYNTQPNHPIAVVTWYEAQSFCKWLNDQQRAQLPNGYAFLLPSEAEWEKAARGGLKISPLPILRNLVMGLSQQSMPKLIKNPAPTREYPWQGNCDLNKANTSEINIGNTSTISCFPNGVSPYGVLEMSGNVWEWTRSLWGKDWQQPDFKYPYERDDGREKSDAPPEILRVMRGGSFHYGDWLARCACRYRGDPDLRLTGIGFRIVVTLKSPE